MTERGSKKRDPKPGTDFGRIPTASSADDRPSVQQAPADQEGKRALFSVNNSQLPPDSKASFGTVVIECSRCKEITVLSPTQALQLVVPSVHLPFIKRDHGSWMRCPSCHNRTWVSVQIKL